MFIVRLTSTDLDFETLTKKYYLYLKGGFVVLATSTFSHLELRFRYLGKL